MAPQRSPLSLNTVANEPVARFHKIISQDNIEQNKLRLPPKFSRKYRNKLSDVAKLKVPDGQDWELEIKREGKDIWLKRGFNGFAQYYSLGQGHLLQFKYKGMSNFTVHIFDTSSCEISYLSQVVDVDSPPRPSTSRNEAPPEYRSANGILSPRHFSSSKPHFDVQLKEYHFTNSIVYVQPEVAELLRAQAINRSMRLEVGDGRHWNVSLLQRKNGRLNLGRMTAFYEENNLKEGDVCIFELVRKNEFKVYLFYAL